MAAVTTVLFDFDGTIADTNHLISESYLHVLNKHYPGKYDSEKVRPFNGPSLDDVFTQINPATSIEMVKEYRTYNHRMHDELIRSFPNVKESLAELRAAGLKLAVVSTKYNEILRKGLDLLELTDYFMEIIGGEDYQNPKPDPEPLELAMSRLGVSPADCLMVGDNWQDIQGARNAGVRSAFVKWSMKTPEEMAPYNPDIMVETMAELTEWILSRYNGGN